MLFAEASDTVQIVTLLCGLAGTMFSALMAFFLARLNRQASQANDKVAEVAVHVEEAAVKVAAVKSALETTNVTTSKKMDGLVAVTNSVHVLVNNAMLVQLRLHAATARRLASLSRNLPEGKENAEAAELAERMLREHESRQKTVDDQGTGP